jgi:hypothetical protein
MNECITAGGQENKKGKQSRVGGSPRRCAHPILRDQLQRPKARGESNASRTRFSQRSCSKKSPKPPIMRPNMPSCSKVVNRGAGISPPPAAPPRDRRFKILQLRSELQAAKNRRSLRFKVRQADHRDMSKLVMVVMITAVMARCCQVISGSTRSLRKRRLVVPVRCYCCGTSVGDPELPSETHDRVSVCAAICFERNEFTASFGHAYHLSTGIHVIFFFHDMLPLLVCFAWIKSLHEDV